MRKKILGAAAIFTFTVCLIVTSNIQGSAADLQNTVSNQTVMLTEDSIRQVTIYDEEVCLSAGVIVAISENSFTTESDEETGIEKKEVTLVTSSKDSSDENEINSEKVEQDTEESVIEADESTEEIIYENRWNISLTEDEIDLLARIVWLEASGEPVEGQEAVVEVIFNRMTSELYPDTLYDVLSQNKPVQFCSWKNREYAHPTETEYQSINNVLTGNTNLLRNDTMNFSTVPLTSNLDVEIGNHSFCY